MLSSLLGLPISAASNIKNEPKAAKNTASPTIQLPNQLSTNKSPSTANASTHLLQGSVIETVKPSPLLYGNLQTMPKGSKLNLSVMGSLNSQLSKVGDDVFAKVMLDVNSGDKVLLPGGWFMHGTVTEMATQKRLGRDGYVTVEFDKLISPDGDIDLPFKTKFSTKDNELKAITKTVLIDSGYMALGATGGSILSVQLTGIPMAIATHGISVGAGAALGGGLGLIGALKRKGKIASFLPGDELSITTAEPIVLPGFDARFIPSGQSPKTLPNLKLKANTYTFTKDPFGDKLSKQLLLSITVNNDTDKEISLFDLAVISDRGQRYYPSLTVDGLQTLKTKAKPHSSITANLAFNVGNSKHKYCLILLDKLNREEIARCQIN